MWDKLSLSEKSQLIGEFVKKGITNLNDIKKYYNEYSIGGNLYAGDEENTQQMNMPSIKRNKSDNSIFDTVQKILTYPDKVIDTALMDTAFKVGGNGVTSVYGKDRDIFNGNYNDVLQDTYLYPRRWAEKAILNNGYSKDKNQSDYGWVKAAANSYGKRKLPIYIWNKHDVKGQKDFEDVGTIDIHSGENNSTYTDNWYGDMADLLPHAGNHTTHIYYNPENGEFYQRGWDLNDYGEHGQETSGASNSYTNIKRRLASLLDIIGNPSVVSSSYSRIGDQNLIKLLNEHPEVGSTASEFGFISPAVVVADRKSKGGYLFAEGNPLVLGIPYRDDYDGNVNPDNPDYYNYIGATYDPTSGHFTSRNQQTGEILKSPKHPTFDLALQEDAGAGYYPYVNNQTGRVHTFTNNQNPYLFDTDDIGTKAPFEYTKMKSKKQLKTK